MEKCIIPGCPHEGGNQLGIRCRRPDTTAVWAPNCNVFFVQRTCRKRMSHRHQDYSRQRWENYDERFRVRLRREYFAGDDDPAEIT